MGGSWNLGQSLILFFQASWNQSPWPHIGSAPHIHLNTHPSVIGSMTRGLLMDHNPGINFQHFLSYCGWVGANKSYSRICMKWEWFKFSSGNLRGQPWLWVPRELGWLVGWLVGQFLQRSVSWLTTPNGACTCTLHLDQTVHTLKLYFQSTAWNKIS